MPKMFAYFRVECSSIRQIEESKALFGRLARTEYVRASMVGLGGKEATLTQKQASRLRNPNDPVRDPDTVEAEAKAQIEVPDVF